MVLRYCSSCVLWRFWFWNHLLSKSNRRHMGSSTPGNPRACWSPGALLLPSQPLAHLLWPAGDRRFSLARPLIAGSLTRALPGFHTGSSCAPVRDTTPARRCAVRARPTTMVACPMQLNPPLSPSGSPLSVMNLKCSLTSRSRPIGPSGPFQSGGTPSSRGTAKLAPPAAPPGRCRLSSASLLGAWPPAVPTS
jgi:hypothetical protein